MAKSSEAAEAEASSSGRGKLIGSVVTVGGLVALIVGAAVFQDPIREFLQYFTTVVDDMGPLGMVLYFFVYAGLEVRSLPTLALRTGHVTKPAAAAAEDHYCHA